MQFFKCYNELGDIMKINRLFEIVYILLEHQCITAKALANRFEVSVRTIYRDIDVLSAAGIPVYTTRGKGGGISLLPNFILNKTVLTESEKTEILSALNAVQAVNLNHSQSVIQRLSNLFGEAQTDWLEIDFSSWGDHKEEASLFQTLKTAIVHKRVIHFLYHNANGQQSSRVAEPLKLCFKGQSWYLYAFCLHKCDYHFFKLRRIKDLDISEQKVQHSSPNHVFVEDNRAYLNTVTVTLKLSDKMGYRVYDEFDCVQVLDDGSFLVTCTLPCDDWLYYYIATFGEHCEIIEPQEIRYQMKDKLQKMLKFYL